MAKPTISLIVPVYNVAPYIETCLKSITAQCFKNFECLIIDDGSPDESIALATAYIQKDERFRIIHHEKNQGLGQARNTGIEHAAGEYICFVDSDDTVEPDYLQLLYSTLKQHNAKIACCNVNIISNGIAKPVDKPIGAKDWQGAISNMLLCIDGGSSCNRIFHRSLLTNTRFPRGKYEDKAFYIELMMNNKVGLIPYVEKPLYNYVMRQQSITHTIDPQTIEDFVSNMIQRPTELITQNTAHYPDWSKQLSYYQLNLFLGLLLTVHGHSSQFYKNCYQALKISNISLKQCPTGAFLLTAQKVHSTSTPSLLWIWLQVSLIKHSSRFALSLFHRLVNIKQFIKKTLITCNL